MLKSQLAEVQFKLKNLTEALALGIYSDMTKQMLDDLEAQKKSIEADMFQLEIRNPVIPKEQIAFALYNYRKLDMSIQSDRQKLIDSFVNSIYLYDDYFIITFNYKNKSKKVSLEEINSSSLTSSTPLQRTYPPIISLFQKHFKPPTVSADGLKSMVSTLFAEGCKTKLHIPFEGYGCFG